MVAALLPMGFVSGMMGPYMLPIPVLSSAAMVFSLFAAFVFVPWLAAQGEAVDDDARNARRTREHRQSAVIAKYYSQLIDPIMNIAADRLDLTLLAIIADAGGRVAMFPLKLVAFKMLPFDNKSEMQVVIDMPEGTDLFVTANLAEAHRRPAAGRSPRSPAYPDLCRHRFAVQLQRSGAALLPAQPALAGRYRRRSCSTRSERSRSSHEIAIRDPRSAGPDRRRRPAPA